MAQSIMPGDVYLTTDNVVVRTVCPFEQITEDMIVKRALGSNLAVGDTILVQCFDHRREILIAEARYTVYAKIERKKHVQVDDRVSRSFMDRDYAVERRGDWWHPGEKIEDVPHVRVQDLEKTEKFIPAEARRIWNPTRQIHEVRLVDNDELLCSHLDKETAIRIASGELPIPEMEMA